MSQKGKPKHTQRGQVNELSSIPGSSDGKESTCNVGWISTLGWEDPLEEGMATIPVFLPEESPWTEEPGGLYSPWGSKELDMTERHTHTANELSSLSFPITDYYIQFSSVQSLSRVWLFAIPWMVARQASLSITNSCSLLTLMSIELVMPSNHLILYRPLLLLPSIFPSIRVFSNESVLHIRWPKYWSFSFNISPSNEHPGLISFRMEWLDLLAVQGITILIYLKLNSIKILNLVLPFCESICVPQYKYVLWIKTGIYDPGVQWRAFIKDC